MSLAAVFHAVQECRAKPPGDPQRIIVVLAPSDCGLPLLYCELLRRRGAVILQAGSLDRKRLGFLKLLAHRTRVVPLLLASAAAWRRWTRRRTLEAAQIGAALIWWSNSTNHHPTTPNPTTSTQED